MRSSIFNKLFYGPFKIAYDNGPDLKSTSKPINKVIRVELNRLQKCLYKRNVMFKD